MKRIAYIILFFILSYWSIAPLLKAGYFPMHDDTQVGRVVVMGRALRNGQFPVRWVSDLGYGYGYPIFNFYGPLPYYAGGFLYALGIQGLTSTKLMFLAGSILSGLFMLLLFSEHKQLLAGLAASVAYMYAPYKAIDIYIRGAVGEYWAMSFFPLYVLGILLVLRKQMKKGVLIGAVGLSGIILSHTILGYVTIVLSLIIFVFFVLHMYLTSSFSVKKITGICTVIVLGLLITAFFWLPALTEMQYTRVSGQVSPTSDFRDHFVCIGQLWNSAWGYGGSTQGCLDGLSFKLGKIYILTAAATLLFFIYRRNEPRRPTDALLALIGIVAGLSVFLSLPYSQYVWEMLPGFAYIQYPWRFLSYTVFSLSVLVGLAVPELHPKGKIPVVLFLLCAILVTNIKLFTPQYIYNRPYSEFESQDELRYRISKISDEYLPPNVPEPDSITGYPKHILSEYEKTDTEIQIDLETYKKIQINTEQQIPVWLNIAHFPGWVYTLDGKTVIPEFEDGRPKIIVPQGFSTIELKFTDTPIRLLGNLVSLVTIGILVFIYGKKAIA